MNINEFSLCNLKKYLLKLSHLNKTINIIYKNDYYNNLNSNYNKIPTRACIYLLYIHIVQSLFGKNQSSYQQQVICQLMITKSGEKSQMRCR